MMPPSPQGTVQEQLVRQYSYLFQMAQQLNVALGQLESGGCGSPAALQLSQRHILPHPPAALRPRRRGSSSIRL